MGLDGGTIISRTDVLRGSSWRLAQADGTRSTRGGSVSTSTVYQAPQVEQDVQRATSWTTCSISGQPLVPPIVACGLGSLYNKDAVLEFLLAAKGTFADAAAAHRYANTLRTAAGAFDHIRSLRDVFEVHPTPNDAALGAASGGSAAPSRSTAGPRHRTGERSSSSAAAIRGGAAAAVSMPYMCPVTQLPCGRLPFSALRSCGCVLSDRALTLASHMGKQAPAGASMQPPCGTCPACDRPYEARDVVPINGSEQQVQQLRQRLAEEAAAAGSKRSKRKRTDASEGNGRVAKALCDGPAAAAVLALEYGAGQELQEGAAGES